MQDDSPRRGFVSVLAAVTSFALAAASHAVLTTSVPAVLRATASDGEVARVLRAGAAEQAATGRPREARSKLNLAGRLDPDGDATPEVSALRAALDRTGERSIQADAGL